MLELTADEAQSRLKELIRAALRGEQVRIRSDDGTVQITPAERPARRVFGSARGKVWMHEDFDAPIDDFADYDP